VSDSVELALNLALAIVCAGGLLFVARVLRGPTLMDRVIAADGFVSTIVIAVTIGAARDDLRIVEVTVLVLALAGFVGTSMLARYLERRGS
jgi:multisubunit Na+/H+ antiporter MnhF subunit